MKRKDFKIKQEIGYKVYDCHYIKYDDGCTRVFIIIDGVEHRVLSAFENLTHSLIERICMSFIYAYELGKMEEQNNNFINFKSFFKKK